MYLRGFSSKFSINTTEVTVFASCVEMDASTFSSYCKENTCIFQLLLSNLALKEISISLVTILVLKL